MEQIKIGDILAGTWGYSMVIPAFYKVVNVTEKRLRLIALPKKMVGTADGGYGQQCYEVPEDVDTIRVNGKEGVLARPWKGWWLVGSKYGLRMLKKWDGQPVYADYCD